MLACKGIFALPSNITSCGATRRTGGGTPPILAIRQVSWEYLTTKQKCVLAQTFLRDRQCRVRAAGTVGGKAPGGCKAASDEGNYTTKRKCLLARAFLLCRRMSHRAALRVARAAARVARAAARRRYLPYGKYHGNIIPRSRNACLQGHFCEAVNCAAAHSAEAAKPPDFAQGKIPAHIILH